MLVGREEELAELEELLGDAPLVALRGAWGSGKTALLEDFCERLRRSDRDLSTTYVDLDGCESEAQVVHRIATSLKLASSDERALVVALRGQAASFLLLDSCDALSDAAWRWIRTLSDRCLGTSIFCATSRTLPVELLQVELRGLDDESAAALFVQFASDHVSSIDLEGAKQIASRVATLLGGLPRSLRIAAAYLGQNTGDALLAQLEAGQLPASGDMKQWLQRFYRAHWDDLTPEERSLLCMIALPRNGIDDDALQLVCERRLLSDLASLQGRGLIERQGTRLRAPLIASFVAAFEPKEVARAREQIFDQLLLDVEQHHHALEFPNITQGRDWYLRHEGLLRDLLSQQGVNSTSAKKLAFGLTCTLNVVGRVDETLIPEAWCDDDDLGAMLRVERARAFLALGDQVAFWREVDLCQKHTIDQVEVARKLRRMWAIREWQRAGRMTEELQETVDAPPEIGRVRGASVFNEGDVEGARQIFEEMASFASSVGDGTEVLHALSSLAIIETQLENLQRAEQLLQRVTSVASELRSKTYLALATGNMAEVKLRQGGKELAREFAARSSADLAALGQAYAYAQARMLQGDLAAIDGEWSTALMYYQQVERLYIEFDRALHKRRVRRRIAVMHQRCGDSTKAKEVWRLADDGETPVPAEQHKTWEALFEGKTLPAKQDDIHWHERLVPTAIERITRLDPSPQPPALELVVSNTYDWFSASGYERYHFRRDTPMRRMVENLVKQRLAAPSVWIAQELLMEVGWPNEHFVGSSGTNRLWVTLSRLRNVGFEPFLEMKEGRYRLSPEHEVRVEAEETEDV